MPASNAAVKLDELGADNDLRLEAKTIAEHAASTSWVTYWPATRTFTRAEVLPKVQNARRFIAAAALATSEQEILRFGCLNAEDRLLLAAGVAEIADAVFMLINLADEDPTFEECNSALYREKVTLARALKLAGDYLGRGWAYYLRSAIEHDDVNGRMSMRAFMFCKQAQAELTLFGSIRQDAPKYVRD